MPTLWSGDPRLRGDGLDDVVAVEELQLSRSSRRRRPSSRCRACSRRRSRSRRAPAMSAAGSFGASQRTGSESHRYVEVADRRARLRRGVAGVVDDRRIGPLLDGAGQRDVGRERRAVARGDVVEAGAERLRRVERLRRLALGDRLDVQRARDLRHRRRRGAHDVAIARRQVAEQDRSRARRGCRWRACGRWRRGRRARRRARRA